MKHFTIELVDAGRQTRQWSIWADNLTVGSDPRCSLVLPAPAPARIGSFQQNVCLALPFGQLLVREDTPSRVRLWDLARERIAKSRLLDWREPGERSRNTRAAVIASLAAVSAFLMGAMVLMGGHPIPVDPAEANTYVIDIPVPDVIKEPPPKPVVPEELEVVKLVAGADKPNPDPNQGGSTETSTIAKPTSSPAAVMIGSVLDKINTGSEGYMGEDVDDNKLSVIDVFLKGGGGSLTKGDRGGMGAGEGDRMAAVGGIGLGNGGRAGIGAGRGSVEGKMLVGITGKGKPGVAMRGIALPKPTDVELGGEAGTRSQESILRVIRTNIGGFRYSYEKALRENPDIGGKISLRFTIAPSGDITTIEVLSSSTGVVALDAEIKDKAKRMKFDAIEKGNVTVTYAFVLDRQ